MREKIFNYLKENHPTKDVFLSERIRELPEDIVDLLDYGVDNNYPKLALILVLSFN